MKFHLPTRDECQEIVKNSEAFYCINTNVQGFEVEVYNYRLASLDVFKEYNAFELRGLCFVKQPTGTWERNILLNKFFNLNENQDWELNNLKNYKITRVQEKLDGSVIGVVKLPNGNIVAKSKMSFDNEQAKMAQDIYDKSENLRNFINDCFENDIVPIFELISPFNQVVINYSTTELRLLQMRYKETGEYVGNILMNSYIKEYNIKCSKDEKLYNFDELLEIQETEQNIEGFVVTLENGKMFKIKTKWYFENHKIITENNTENKLIPLILEDKIDDILSITTGEKKLFIENIIEIVQHKFNHLVIEYKNLRGFYYNKFNENKKEFALKYKNHELFGYVCKNLNTSFRDIEEIAEKSVKEFILKKTRTLTDAREFIKN